MRTLIVKTSLFAVILCVSFNAFAANDKAFLWEVENEAATVYLMGSIHFADSSFYPLREDIEKAFQHSRHLVVELDVNKIDANAYNRALAEKGTYTDGKTIRDHVSEETWLQLKQYLQRLNISYDAVKNYKPGVLVLILTAMQVIQLGFEPQYGIDVYFLDKAKEVKNIIELETLEQQLKLFLDITDGELLLKESLYSLAQAESMMADIVNLWKQGDAKQMNKMLFEDALMDHPGFGEIYEQIFHSRNKAMTEKIEGMLKTDSIYFVVVGSGHLVGDKGIVKVLRNKGYAVERR